MSFDIIKDITSDDFKRNDKFSSDSEGRPWLCLKNPLFMRLLSYGEEHS